MASREFLDMWNELAPQFKIFHARTTIEDYRHDWDQIFTVTRDALPAHSEKVRAGGVDAEWIWHPDSAASRNVVLYLHGGGFALGSLASHRDLMARISQTSHAKVLGLAYRLAPEHPFPAANANTEAAWRWLLAQGYASGQLAIAGDSAGGGLTLTTALRLRDLGLPPPSSLVMFSPWADLTQSGASMASRAAVDRLVTAEILDKMAAVYLQGRAVDEADVRICPLHADFSGLPPMLVQVGTDEILYDDATRIVDRAGAAGISARLSPFAEMCHVFQLFAHRIPEATRAIEETGQFMIDHFHA